MLFQFIYIRYVSYNVDKEVYGNFILLQTLVSALSMILLQIPSQAYDRFYNEAKDKISYVNEFRTILIFVNIVSMLLIFIYSLVIQKFSIEILSMIFLYFVILNNYTFNQKVFLLNLQRSKFLILKLFESIAKFITPLIAYYYYETLISFLIGITVGYLISFMIMMNYMREYPFKINIDFEHYKKYFIFAYPILFVSIFSWGISFSDRYFIEYLSGTKDVAIYALLAQVAGMGQVVGQVYSMYINPKVLKYYEEDESFALNYLKKSIYILSIIFVALGAIAYALPISVYEILLKPEIINNGYYFNTFFILLIAIFLTLTQTALSMYLVLKKK